MYRILDDHKLLHYAMITFLMEPGIEDIQVIQRPDRFEFVYNHQFLGVAVRLGFEMDRHFAMESIDHAVKFWRMHYHGLL